MENSDLAEDASPEERRQSIAAILARGVLRMSVLELERPSSGGPSDRGEDAMQPLEPVAKTRLSGEVKRDQRGPQKRSRPGSEDTAPALTTTTLLRERDCHG
jgi:hypothetical protein